MSLCNYNMKKTILYLLPLAFLFFQCGGTKTVTDTVKDATKTVTDPINAFRQKAPAAGPAPKIQLGDYETFTLSNGLQVVVVENHKLPRVSFQLLLDNDPTLEGDAAGTASMAGQMLTKGTKTRTKAQLDEEIDFIGARLATNDNGLFAASLTKHVPKLLELMSDVVLNPAFPSAELEKMKKQQLSALASDKDDPNAIARNVGNVLRYGKDHPYGELTTEESVKNITLDNCKKYYNTYFKPNSAYMAVVGDITPTEAKAELEKYLGTWKKGTVPTHTYDTPKAPDATQVAFVNKDEAVQSVISVTYPVDLKPGTPDAIKASVMNSILGGGVFSGRLMQNLREDKAFTYGARSSLRTDKLVGRFSAGASVRNEVTDSSVVEFVKELNIMRNTDVDQKDLNLVLNSMTGSFARSLERPETMARFALNTIRYKLPSDYYATYLEKLNAVTRADVKAMAEKYIRPDNAYILVVGNQDEVASKLGRFASSGKVDFYDKQGNPIENVAAPTNINPTTIINKFIEATGGKAAYEARKDYTMKMETEMQGMKLNIVEMRKSPNKHKNMVTMGGQVVQGQVFDGVKAKLSGMGGNKEAEGDELAKIKSEAIFNKEINYEKLGYTFDLKGVEKIDDKDTYKVKVTSPDGGVTTEYYDQDSGLKLREVQTQDSPAGKMTITADYADYKEVDGLMIPHTIKQQAGPQNFTLKVVEYKINTGLSDDEFKVE